MADSSIILNKQSTLANTPENFGFTSPTSGKGTLITSVVVSNDTALLHTYKAYIVPLSGTATLPQVPTRTIDSKKTDVPPELTAQVIPAGGTIQFESDAATTLIFTVTGRNLT